MSGASESRKAGDSSEKLQTTGQGSALPQELVEVLKGESSRPININILLQQVAEKENSPERAMDHARELIGLSERYEDRMLEVFQARTRAIIAAKTDDPDEIEKRLNNRVRRQLKIVLAGCAVAGMTGMLLTVATGGPIVVIGLLAAIGVVSIGMLGPLASGESISSNDVVSMVTALGRVVGRASKDEDGRTGRNNRKRK